MNYNDQILENKTFNFFKQLMYNIALALCIMLVGVLIMVYGFKIRLYEVLSDSQYPVFKKGDMVVVVPQKEYKVGDIISYLVSNYKCVRSLYIRTIRSIGNAESMSLLSKEDIDIVYNHVFNSSLEFEYINFSFNLGIEYESVLYDGVGSDVSSILTTLDYMFCSKVSKNFSLYLEDSCGRYTTQVTVTPDGYVLGCASEVASDKYNELSVGNIKDHSLEYLIKKGKNEVTRTCNENMCSGCKKCSFLL